MQTRRSPPCENASLTLEIDKIDKMPLACVGSPFPQRPKPREVPAMP